MALKLNSFLLAVAVGCGCLSAMAQNNQPEYQAPPARGSFMFSAQSGYGITSSNQKGPGNSNPLHGITVSFSLGFRFSDHFCLEAGPSFWLSATDVFTSNAAGKEKPVDKRTLVTLSGVYRISDKFPLSVRLGAGAGSLVYTPAKNTVTLDEQKFGKTEIISGLGGMTGVSYRFRLSEKTDLFTGINCWYLHLNEPDISYDSAIDWNQPSLTTELFVRLQYKF
jgi:hypothetical protein